MNTIAREVTLILEQQGTLTPDQYAELIKSKKPYLVAIDEAVQRIKTGHGEIEIKLVVHNYQVDKITFWQGESWLRDKNS